MLATKYCFLILGNDTSFFFFFSVFFIFMLSYFVITNFCKNVLLSLIFFFQKNQFNFFMFHNVLRSLFSLFFVFCFFSGGGGNTFSLKLPIFEDFLKNKNLTKICFKMVFYKDHHRMITPNSNIFQRQYNIYPMPHNLFWNRERRIIKNSVRTMKEWLKPLTGRYNMALPPYVSL